MSSIIVRNIDDTTHARLKREAVARGVSVNALMQQFIRSGLRMRDRQPSGAAYRDLDSLAGKWTDRDESEFFANIAPLAEVDEALWK